MIKIILFVLEMLSHLMTIIDLYEIIKDKIKKAK